MINRNTTLVVRNADMRNRNFEGRAGKYNAEGQRSFSILIKDDTDISYRDKTTNTFRPVTLEELAEDGWNIKIKTNDETGENFAFLSVAVSYTNPRMQPKIVQSVYSGENVKNTIITQATCATVDTADITNISVEINPRFWGDDLDRIKAYLNSMRYTLIPDIFDDDFETFNPENDDSGLPFEL